MAIWAVCKDAVIPGRIEGELVRVVESQEQVATNSLVDDFDEQSLLEKMLDGSKPPAPADTVGLHYLLSTPFRYPPLKHGSRFGTREERSIFYASTSPDTALAETAYYRFVFWSGMVEAPPSGKFMTDHTLFGALYLTDQGLRLHEEPFLRFRKNLLNPSSYAETQALGAAMREAGIEGFEFLSARDESGEGINIALFAPHALGSKEPDWQKSLLCETRDEKVSFYSKEFGARVFSYDSFRVDGNFPSPAV